MIHQFTVEVSAALLEFMTNDVPLTIEATGAERMPCVPPGVLHDTMMIEPVATTVVETVTVPATSVAVPIEAFEPVAIFSLFPAVVRATLPVTSRKSVGVPVPFTITFPSSLVASASTHSAYLLVSVGVFNPHPDEVVGAPAM